MMKNNIISLDTVKAYTKLYLDDSDLLAYDWNYYKQSDDYCLMVDNIRLYYRPKYNYLAVSFSASKIQNGANFIAFNFRYSNELIEYVNQVIKENVPVCVDHFREWTVNRMDVHVDYAFTNKNDLAIYQRSLSKVRYSRCKKTNYKSGNRAFNKSYGISIYDKKDEIAKRTSSGNKVNKKEKSIIINRGYNVLRLEVQIKRVYLKKIFKENRRVVDLFNILSCEKVISHFMTKTGIDKPFLSRRILFDKINDIFSSLQGKRLKKFLDYYNKYGLEATEKTYKASTISAYFRMLKKANLNPIYLTGKVSYKTNMSYYTTICRCKRTLYIKREEVISETNLYRYKGEAYYNDRGG